MKTKELTNQFKNILRTPSFKLFLEIDGEESYHEFNIYEENGAFIIDFDINCYSPLKLEAKPYLSLKDNLQILYDDLLLKIKSVGGLVCEYSDNVNDVCILN